MPAAQFDGMAALPGKCGNFFSHRNAFANAVRTIFPAVQRTNEAVTFDESIGQPRAQMGAASGQNRDFTVVCLVTDKIPPRKARAHRAFRQIANRSQIIPGGWSGWKMTLAFHRVS